MKKKLIQGKVSKKKSIPSYAIGNCNNSSLLCSVVNFDPVAAGGLATAAARLS